MADSPKPTASPADFWVKRFCEKDMPVLGHTVQGLKSVSTDAQSSAGDLATVVLQDPAMTSELLRIANSAYYNAHGFEINTISRAVVMLGFDAVRSIGLSLSVLETFLGNRPKKRVLNIIRQAVYAGVQAKLIAEHSGDRSPEEIFIAALLYRLGDLAFWTFGSERDTEALGEALQRPGDPRQAEMQVLGCTLRQITAGLAREWHLGEVLEDALNPRPGTRPRGRHASVLLGHELEAAVREHGWESSATRAVTAKICEAVKLPAERMPDFMNAARKELKKAADAFGVKLELETGAAEAPAAPTPVVTDPKPCAPRQPEPAVQLKVLRDLSLVMEKQPDIQVVLDMVMEGIYRGMAMDRALLSILTPDRKALKVKYALGDDGNLLAAGFNVGLLEPENAVLRWALSQRKPVWTRELPPGHSANLLSKPVQQRLAADFFLGPLIVRGKDIGLIYADCRLSGRELDQEAFASFHHFIDQANLCLERIARR